MLLPATLCAAGLTRSRRLGLLTHPRRPLSNPRAPTVADALRRPLPASCSRCIDKYTRVEEWEFTLSLSKGERGGVGLVTGGEGAGHFKVGVAFGDDLALVKGFAPAREAELHLGFMAGDVEPQGNQGVAARRDALVEGEDLAAVEQQLAGARRLMVVDVSLRVRRDVHAVQPYFSARYACERVSQGDTTGPQGFYLGSGEDKAGLQALQDVVIESGAAIIGDQPIPAGGIFAGFCLCPVPSSL